MRGEGSKHQIGDRYALDYYRQRWATRAWKSRWNWTALIGALAAVAGLYVWQRERAFYAAPVSSAHAVFGTQCSACHDDNWQTLARLVRLDDHRHSATDAACRKCHDSADHPAGHTPAPSCAACHQEHRPEQDLAVVSDQRCTMCHADLTNELPDGPRFHAEIRSFAAGASEHPEFALLRNDIASTERRGELALLASFANDDAPAAWRDRGGLKFNHVVHLTEDGVLDANREKVQLKCANCHIATADGAYMAPLNYEQHCANCHPLRLGGDLAGVGDVPHAGPEEVRGTLRERLANIVDTFEGGEAAAESPAATRLPLLPSPAKLTESEARRVDDALSRADNALLGPAAKGGCRYCHHIEAAGQSWVVHRTNPTLSADLPREATFQALMVPDRWLPYGGFDHRKHRTIECQSCHPASASRETADLLLPSIDVCRQCHTGEATTSSASVRADCVLCHKYHGEGGQFEGVPIDELVGALRQRPR